MRRKTGIEISDEVKALESVKSKLPLKNFFGESIPAQINAAIKVLRGDIDEDAFEDMVDSGDWSDTDRENAQQALDWMNGNTDDPAPSQGWIDIVS